MGKKKVTKQMRMKQRPRLWIERFPWCRETSVYSDSLLPPITKEGAPTRYPPHLEECAFLLEEERFRKFMRLVWGLEITPMDLNALEYYGLLIPVRKAFLPLLLSSRSPKTTLSATWMHKGYAWSKRLNARISRDTLHMLSINPDSEPEDIELHAVHPTPILVLRRDGSDGTDGRSSPTLGASEPADRLGPATLRQMGSWCRPIDPIFWSALSWRANVQGGDAGATRETPQWLRTLLGPFPNAAFKVTPLAAACGNFCVTRFYVVGGLLRPESVRCEGPPRFFRGMGQDWWLAQLMRRLRLRMNPFLSLGIEDVMQQRRINAPLQLYERFCKQWRRWTDSPQFKLPQLVPEFHRYALMWLTHRARPRDIGAAKSHEAIARLAGLETSSVRHFISLGHQYLSAK